MGAIIAAVSKTRASAADTAKVMLNALTNHELYGLASPSRVILNSSPEEFDISAVRSRVVLGYAFNRIIESDTPQPAKTENSTFVFEGRIYPPRDALSDVELFNQAWHKTRKDIHETCARLHGDFAVIIAESNKLICCRDPVGMRPMYYGGNRTLAVVSSEKKALWKIGINEPTSFPPGNTATVNENGFEFTPYVTLQRPKPTDIESSATPKLLERLLRKSVNERIKGLDRAGIAFSGGLDSAIITILACETCKNVQLIHSSLEGQAETEHAIALAKTLNIPLSLNIHGEEDVQRTIPKVLRITEQSDTVGTGIGIAIYWAAEKSKQEGLNVLLAGQGADELFGGYKRYVDCYAKEGAEETEELMFHDFSHIHETNLERDSKICDYHGIELRLPFVDMKLATFASALPISLKIQTAPNENRKAILRKVAQNLGLPDVVTERPKKAIQYATGIHRTIEKLAREHDVSTKEYVVREFDKIRRKF